MYTFSPHPFLLSTSRKLDLKMSNFGNWLLRIALQRRHTDATVEGLKDCSVWICRAYRPV